MKDFTTMKMLIESLEETAEFVDQRIISWQSELQEADERFGKYLKDEDGVCYELNEDEEPKQCSSWDYDYAERKVKTATCYVKAFEIIRTAIDKIDVNKVVD